MATKTSFTLEETQNRFRSLPSDIQQIIYGIDMHNAVLKIGGEHHLHIDLLEPLEAEIGHAMLGFTEPQDFPDMLVENLGVTKETADAIAHDVDIELFQKIRESMKKMAELNDAPPQETAPAAIKEQPMPLAQAPAAPLAAPAATTPPAPQVPQSLPETMPEYLPEVKKNVEPIFEPLSVTTVQKAAKMDVGKLPNQAATSSLGATEQAKKYTVDPYREPVA